jgi:glycerol-3-phosphate acyltransferase PlsY
MLFSLFCIASYLLGSIPFGLVIGKIFYKKDIRDYGSGNIGATNASRAFGKKIGAIVFVLDGLKGVMPCLFYSILIGDDHIAIIGMFAVVGHIFPIYMKFAGGKGVSTTLCMYFYLNIYFGIAMFAIWIISLLVSRYVSLSSIVMSLSSVIVSVFINTDWGLTINKDAIALNFGEFQLFCFVTYILIIYKHIPNIKRIMSKSESKVFSNKSR